MKIAFIISDYNFHGGAQKTATLAKHLELLGHNVTIIVIRCRKGDLETRPSHFSNILDLNAKSFFLGIFKLRKIFFHSEYDTHICIGGYANLVAGLAKILSRSSIFLIGSENFSKSVFIGDYPKWYLRLFLPAFRLIYRQLNGLIFVSERLRSKFLEKNSWHPSRCITIFNPVKSFKKKFKENLKIKDSGFIFLGAGVLEPRKRFDLLLKSFSIVSSENDKLLIAGNGSLKFDLETLAKELGVDTQVIFLGFVEDLNLLMDSCDVLVLTSNSEAFGMVLAEGLASGLQVVSTNSFSGPAEVLGNGRYGFLAEVDNLSSIASSMRAAIETPKDSEIIYEGASRFSLDKIVNQYLNFISSVKKSKGNLNDPI